MERGGSAPPAERRRAVRAPARGLTARRAAATATTTAAATLAATRARAATGAATGATTLAATRGAAGCAGEVVRVQSAAEDVVVRVCCHHCLGKVCFHVEYCPQFMENVDQG